MRHKRLAWRLGGALIALVLVAACGQDVTSPSTTEPATTTITTTATTLPQPTTSSTIDSADPDLPSQAPEDAQRDGVIADLAALPMSIRVSVVDDSQAAEGLWAISVPLPDVIEPHTEGCRLGSDEGVYPTDFICTAEYGELVLLETSEGPIVRAVPLPGIPPEILLVSEDAVYCGRSGEGRMPDSMICRVDRSSGEVLVTVFPGVIDSIVDQPCYYPPENWVVAESPLEVLEMTLDSNGLWVREEGGWALLDPITLAVQDTGLPAPGTG